jgi:hypothetical protein
MKRISFASYLAFERSDSRTSLAGGSRLADSSWSTLGVRRHDVPVQLVAEPDAEVDVDPVGRELARENWTIGPGRGELRLF